MTRTVCLTLFLLLLSATARAETLTLHECLKRAAAANYGLRVAAYDEKIVDENRTIARSGFLPRLDFQGGYTAQKDPQAVKIQGNAVETQDADFGFFNLTLTQTVYDFGRTRSRYRRASLLKEAASHDYAGREKETFLQVVQAYYAILQTGKLLQAADEEVTQRMEHLRIAANLYEQGVTTRNDLLQAEVKLAESRQKRLATANRLENGWLYLNFLTGQPLENRAELEERTEVPHPAGREDMVAEALKRRPEVAALNGVIQAGEEEVGEGRSGFYPEIFAKMGVDYVQNSKVEEQAIMSATVGLRFNLFDGLATSSRLRQSVKALSRSRESLRLLEEQIRFELQAALNDSRVAAERIKTVETAIRQGEENLRINEDRYQEQVGTATEVLDAQTLLTEIKSDYYNALFDYQVAVARVRKAMGEL